eukprot:TRINITY_DN7637_c0_g1_i1.p1 TRINITY_DN7637_c0_g1~~TRINITY_DN7637_c0_g1_i1.p1  ORF type:complete len:1380 (-),score=647.08 TRINITY_DN7637_c0_g1_i1:49-4188(-)
MEAHYPKLIPAALNLYKKDREHLPITHGIFNILNAACKDKGTALQPLLPIIFSFLHPLVCAPINIEDPVETKNFNELLRCFECLGRSFLDALLAYLITQLNSKDSNIRAGTLAIVRQLINRLDDEIQEKKDLILSGLKVISTTETSLLVRKRHAQGIVSMVPRGYFNLDGCEHLVDFVVRNCSLSDSELTKVEATKVVKGKGEEVTGAILKSACENIMTHIFLNNLTECQKALWPYLMEYLTKPGFNEGLGTVCKTLAYIANSKRENDDEDYLIDFVTEVNIPKPHAMISRLAVVLTHPLNKNHPGQNVLECMQALGPVLHPSVHSMWDNSLPKLSAYIEKNKNNWKPQQWEDLVMRLIAETIKLANDDDWTLLLGDSLTDQFDLYKDDPDMKKSTLKLMGLILQKMNKKDFVRAKLEVVFNSTDHNVESARVGCAQAFGYCAAAHFDICLEKLQEFIKGPKKKEGGLFSKVFSSAVKDGTPTPYANTCILCLGYVAAFGPASQLSARAEIVIYPILKPYMSQKNILLQEHLLKASTFLGKALNPENLKTKSQFKTRDEMLKFILDFMSPVGPQQTEVPHLIRTLGFEASRALIHLEPLAHTLELDLVERCCSFLFQMPEAGAPAGVLLNQKGQPIAPPKGQLAPLPIDQETYDSMYKNFKKMMAAILVMDPTTKTLTRLFKIMDSWYRSPNEIARRRCCETSLYLLNKYLKYNIKEDQDEEEEPVAPPKESAYDEFGTMLGLFIPRVCDTNETVRLTSHEAIQLILYIENYISSHETEYPDDIAHLPITREKLSSAEEKDKFSAMNQTTIIIAKRIDDAHLKPMIMSALRGLIDLDTSSSASTCVFLNGIMKSRGKVLLGEIPVIVEGILGQLAQITDDKTMNGTLHSLRNLATWHLLPVLDHLLDTPVPHFENVKKSALILCKDPRLVEHVFSHLISILNDSQVIEGGDNASKLSVSATVLMGEMFESSDLDEFVQGEFFPQLACSLLLRFGTASGLKSKEPLTQAVAAFRNFVERVDSEEISAAMGSNDNWRRLETAEYTYVLVDIAQQLCQHKKENIEEIFNILLPYLKGNYKGQRVVVSNIFSEFINQIKDDKTLLNKLINSMLASLVDESIKISVLRGLGNVASCGQSEVDKYGPTIVDALMSNIDDSDEIIAMEAISGLSKVFELVDESRVAPILINICHRIRPALEKPNDKIRAVAFTLFGNLWRFGTEKSPGCDVFFEQIHSNLPSLIVHTQDENIQVQKNCRKALAQLGPLLRSPEIETFLTKVNDVSRSLSFDDFANGFTKLLIATYPDRVNYYVMTCIDYFKSNWTGIRCAAVTFIGFTLRNIPLENRKRSTVNPGLVTDALISLMKDSNASVRVATANAMGLLHTY